LTWVLTGVRGDHDPPPFTQEEAATGRTYGVKAVCSTLCVPLSSFYEKKRRKRSRGRKPEKRGPVQAVSDEKLLALIREDLASSPFTGEGHRKVWAGMNFGKGIAVSRKRVLRIMWGTDGARVFTRCEGWGWIFVNVEHWNAEVMGWHVCKKGDRFAALEPVSMGIMSGFGSVERGQPKACLSGWITGPSIYPITSRSR